MREEVVIDLTRSAHDFLTVVWPAIAVRVRGGTVYSVELAPSTDPIRQRLDILAGIDAWQCLDDQGRMRGLASRVQWIPEAFPPYNTFTIRWTRPGGAATEIHKRLAAIADADGGWLLPHLTIQAYLNRSSTKLLSVGVVRTRDLYGWINNNRELMEQRHEIPNKDDSSTFKAISWRELKCAGVRLTALSANGSSQLGLPAVAEPCCYCGAPPGAEPKDHGELCPNE